MKTIDIVVWFLCILAVVWGVSSIWTDASQDKVKDMVQEEILKTVKPECLIDGSVTIPDDVKVEMAPGSTIQTR